MTAVVPDRAGTVAPAAPGAPAAADRHARAWAALRAAEQRTGAQPAAPSPRSASAPRGAVPPERRGPEGGHRLDSHGLDGPRRPVHPDLAELLPGGVLRGGSVIAVQGSATLLLALLAAASADGAWIAFVGAPTIGMLAAAEVGIDLSRTALVPAPGPDAPLALAALLDGMDVVVAGPQAALTDADRRRLAARARERDAVLVSQTRWPGACVTLDARGGAWSGVEQGAGWLRRRTLSVLRTGRGAVARPVEIEVEVPVLAEVVVPAQDDGHDRGHDLGRDTARGERATPGAGVPAGDGPRLWVA